MVLIPTYFKLTKMHIFFHYTQELDRFRYVNLKHFGQTYTCFFIKQHIKTI